MTINGNDIRMIRGDTEQLVVTCQLSDGTERPFEDTNDLTPGEYAYDVQLTAKDGTVATIIPPARFVLEGDVTRD